MTKIQVRRDTAANWTSNDPVLAVGEYECETDTGYTKCGDGTTAWTSLPYDNLLANLQDVVVGTPSDGQVLTYESATSKYKPKTPASGVTDHTLLSNIGTNSHETIDTFISSKGAVSGLAPLNASSKIDTTYLPDSIVGALEYKGAFDCSGEAYPSEPETGWYYVCSVEGTISTVVYSVGDWLVYNGTTWDKIDNTDAVLSVDGATGAIDLTSTYVAIPESGVQGDILYYNGTGYTRLGYGDDGKVLLTHGTGENPSWGDIDGGDST